jgi:Ca-activated chloride channel family protein
VRFDWPFVLPALLLVPLVVLGGLAIRRRRRPPYALQFTNIEVLATVPAAASRWRSYAPPALVLLALTCALVALARPAREVSVTNEQTSIVLAVDTSASMAAADVSPTRLAAADQGVRRFLARVPAKYRVGLVTFSSAPQVAAPLSWNRGLVVSALRDADAPGAGTAIGDALARAVELLQPIARPAQPSSQAFSSTPSPTPIAAGAPSAIVFLSDGAQTRGRLSPLAGAGRAAADGIPVYTIALGTATGVVHEGVLSLRVPPDPAVLQRISQATGGTFFAAMDEADLDVAYQHLASRIGRTTEWHEVGSVFMGLAALLALAGGVLSLCWSERLP